MEHEITVKCPVCGKPYAIFSMYCGDQSACRKCRNEARKDLPKYEKWGYNGVKPLAKLSKYHM